MAVAGGRRFWFGAIVLASAFAVAAVVAVQLLGPPGGDTGRTAAAPPSSAPPGTQDSLNPAVWVPGGTFRMGSDHQGKSDDPASPFHTGDERPPRRMTVDGFWIQAHEVTNEEYRRFDPGHEFAEGEERHPVVGVTWRQAMEYARSVGGTLPTEAQWEMAAEGTENREYPWGDAEPNCERAHFRGCSPNEPIEVTSRPEGATPGGVQGLAGNVWEWVTPTWFVPGRTPVNEESRALRGGSFRSPAFFLRPSFRSNVHYAGTSFDDTGFRVAWTADGERR